MDLSKLLFVLLFLVKTINSTKYNYCNASILQLNKRTAGRRYFIPLDYRHQIIKEVNMNRNNSDKPMNYMNWDIELDKMALNLLKIITFYETSTIHGVLGCLVRTPLRNDLYVYGDSTTNVKLNITKDFKLTERDKFCKFASEEQNITSVGCAIWIMEISNSIGGKDPKTHIVCLFSGINGKLLGLINSNFSNLRGQSVTEYETDYEYLEDKLDIALWHMYVMYILTGLTYMVIFLCYVFLLCLKWYHKKALMSDVNDDWDGY